MKVTIDDIGGKVIKEDDRYVVKDNTTLNRLVLSSTKLNANKATSGHLHEGQEEVYMFVKGTGRMTVGEETFDVQANDIVPIPDGLFHKVEAGPDGIYFVCVFDGIRHTEETEAIEKSRNEIIDMYTTKGT